VAPDREAVLPAGLVVNVQANVSESPLTSLLAAPLRVTSAPTRTFCVEPATAVGAVLPGVGAPDDPPPPPPPHAARAIAKTATAARQLIATPTEISEAVIASSKKSIDRTTGTAATVSRNRGVWWQSSQRRTSTICCDTHRDRPLASFLQSAIGRIQRRASAVCFVVRRIALNGGSSRT
jgi:hypothetical protein